MAHLVCLIHQKRSKVLVPGKVNHNDGSFCGGIVVTIGTGDNIIGYGADKLAGAVILAGHLKDSPEMNPPDLQF